MTVDFSKRSVEITLELRITDRGEPGDLTGILTTLREAGGDLRGHLVESLSGTRTVRCVCEHPAEAGVALRGEGFQVETETVVTVRTENRPGAFSHLVRSLEVAEVEIEYSYATSVSGDLFVVVRATNNPRAEDVLRNYLELPDHQNP